MTPLSLFEQELNLFWMPTYGWQFDRIWLGANIDPADNAFMNWYANINYFIDNNEWLFN